MNVDPFRILLASQPVRERLVAEIFVENEQIAEISQEILGKFVVEIFARPSGGLWSFDLCQFQKVLDAAIRHLAARTAS